MQLRPLPGVTLTRILDAIQVAAQEVVNVRGAGGTALDRFNAYQRWSNTTAGRLEPLLAASDVDALVTTPRYWVLQGLDPAGHGHLAGIVDLELDNRHRVLEAALDRARSDLKVYEFAGLQVVPDTNALIHQPVPLEEQDWGRLTGARHDPLTLFVPLAVIDELDNLKRSPDKKTVSRESRETVRSRARTTLKTFDALFYEPTWRATLRPADADGGAVYVRLLMDQLGHQRLPRTDDEIVDVTRALQDYTGRQVSLATSDTGMRLRARMLGVQTIDLP